MLVNKSSSTDIDYAPTMQEELHSFTRYQQFEVGQSAGASIIVPDDALVQAWLALYPLDARYLPHMPIGMAPCIVMRAGMTIINPRPAGTLHIAQSISMYARPEINAAIRVEFICTRKRMVKDQQWLHFKTECRDVTGFILFSGKMKLIWPLMNSGVCESTPGTQTRY